MFLRSMMLSSTRYVPRAADEPSGAAAGTEGSDTGQQDQEQARQASEGGKPTVIKDGPGSVAAEAADGDDGGDGGEGGEGDQQQQPDPNAWKDKELKRKHRQLQEEKRRAQELERQLADAQALLERNNRRPAAGEGDQQQQQPDAGRGAPQLTEAEVEARAERIAETRLAKQSYDQQCNAAAEQGAKKYGKAWDKSVEQLEQLGGFDIDTMMGVLATDDPAKVLHSLGSNPDEYHRVMELPPAKRQTEMVKLALKPEKKAKVVSDATEPVEPVAGRGNAVAAGELRDDMSDDEWYRRRAAQKKARWESQRGGGRAA